MNRSSTSRSPFVWTTLLGAAGSLAAQNAPAPAPTPPPETSADPTRLPEVVVSAETEKLYKAERLQSPKITAPLRDVPQTITVIPKAVMEDRGAFSLRDVLRNTPGISMQAGEGGGGLPGDNLSIRGFASRNDLYIDGVRDLGAYSRDPFNMEQVEITKGPASTNNGRGSTGGSINMVSKAAHLTQDYTTSATVGTDNLYRGTVDFNQPLSEHSALRLNGMYHSADAPGRDEVNQERFGIAGSLAFGLGTDTRFTLNYQHLQENNLPDYGIPWVPANASGSLADEANEAPSVDFDNYYGRVNTDFEDVQSDLISGILEHDFNDAVKLRNVTRYGRTYRHSILTAPRFTSAATGSTQINRQLQRREMTSEVLSNLTNVNLEFDTGPLQHSVAAGMELSWERQLNANASLNLPAARTDLENPDPSDPYTGVPTLPGAAESHLDTTAFYLFDTVRIGRHVEVNAGLRYDHLEYEARGAGGTKGFSNSDDLVSWKLGVVYKPVEHGSIYAGYGTSFNPSIDTNLGLGLSEAQAALNPEENRNYELGTKWDLLDERLSLTAAVFRTEKTNARTTDVAGNTVLAGNQVVDGVELGVSGNLTKNWQIFAGYSYMESEVKESGNTAELGQTLGNTPDHSFNLWTTYNLPKNVQVGFGAQYVGDRQNGNTNTARTAPGYWTLDAMVNYQVNDHFSLRLNVYNLADERYIDRVGGGHFIPGAGRSAALTATYKF